MSTKRINVATILPPSALFIGYVAENGVTNVEFDVSAWVTMYGSGTATLIMKRWGDANPYPIALEVDNEGLATWTISATDTAKKGFAYAQLRYEAGTKIKKSPIYTLKIGESLGSPAEAPDQYEDWIDALTHIAAQAIAEVLDIEGIVTDKTLTVDGGIADGKATGDALALKADKSTTYTKAEVDQMIEDVEVETDTTLEIAGAPADAAETGRQFGLIKADLDALPAPPVGNSSITAESDLDISDESGNVIVRFANGHVYTKNFDSSDIDIPDIPDVSDAHVDNVGIVDTSDFIITDENGNAIVQFKDGGIKTKAFDSAAPVERKRLDYSVTVNYSGAMQANISQHFNAGDTLILHTSIVGNEVADTMGQYLISYYGVKASGSRAFLASDYGYNFPKVTITEDYEAIQAVLPNGLIWGASGSIKFMVYHTFGDDVTYKTVTVKQDGSGDFQTLRAAIDSITDNNALTRYVIEVYPGQYDVMDGYTAEEITSEDFKGIIVKNGLYLVGVGQIDDIIINAELDTEDYTSTERNRVSTLNLAGECGLKNLTIKAKNMRYAIHDDIGSVVPRVHTLENVKLHAEGMTSASAYNITFGCGTGNRKNLVFKNVDFGDTVSIHGSTGWTYSPQIYFENCSAKVYQFGEYVNTEMMYITMNNCKGTAIRMVRDSEHAQTTRMSGVGTCGLIMDCYPGFVYDLGDCVKTEDAYSFTVGQAVKLGTAYGLVATTDKSNMYGIVLGQVDGHTIVQRQGFLDANTFGISGLSVGDYVHLDSNGVLSAGGTASDAVGVVVSTSTFEGGAFIKMM